MAIAILTNGKDVKVYIVILVQQVLDPFLNIVSYITVNTPLEDIELITPVTFVMKHLIKEK